MSARNKLAGTLSAMALLAGCATTLDVQSDPGTAFSEGIPQVLPFTQFEITATWRLAACDENGATIVQPSQRLRVRKTTPAIGTTSMR